MENPKFLLSKSKVLEQFDKVQEFADIVSYSSKTNPLITPILENERNCMFSIHLLEELKNIKDPAKILFFAQGWNVVDIKNLLKKKINWFVVDNENDLNVLLDVLKKSEIKVNLLLRMKIRENTLRTEKYFVFGMNSEIITKKIIELRKNKNINLLGIHFHKKTQNMSEWDLKQELEDVLDKKTLDVIDILNIGGGFPSVYANTNSDVLPGIFKKVINLKEWLNSLNIKMIIEPGRFIAAPAGELITKIISIYEDNIIVNASIYNTDLDALIVPVKLLIKGELDKGKAYKVKGKTPCSMDLFRYKVYLDNPKVGDKLVFINAGAYNFSSDFCDLEKVETEIVK